MDRRSFVLTSFLMGSFFNLFHNQSFAKQEEKKLLKPKCLQKGDKVGIIAPASAVSDPDELRKATEILNILELDYQFGKYVNKGSGYKSRTIQERVEDLHWAFSDKSIKAVFCIRGGYSSAQILEYIDYNLIRDNPKIFLGYSDITALHLAISKFSGLVTFHGPMLLSPFSAFTLENFRKVLFEKNDNLRLTNPTTKFEVRNPYPIRTIFKGSAEGELIGGNLTTICSLMGTKYEIETKDKILFLEDVGEQPYRIDRMLTQLKLSGKLQQAKGIIFGECVDCQVSSTNLWDYSLGEVLDIILGDLKIPVISGLVIGHTSNQLTLPIGIKAELNATEGYLKLLEPAVL